MGSGAPNGVKFDITNPDKITKIAQLSSLIQESIHIHFICIFSSH